MEVTVVCPNCKHRFQADGDRIERTGKPPKCEECGERTKVSNQELLKPKSGSNKKRGLKCDVCGKHLPEGVRFCAKCGVHVEGDPTNRLHSMNLSLDETKRQRQAALRYMTNLRWFFNPFRWFT